MIDFEKKIEDAINYNKLMTISVFISDISEMYMTFWGEDIERFENGKLFVSRDKIIFNIFDLNSYNSEVTDDDTIRFYNDSTDVYITFIENDKINS